MRNEFAVVSMSLFLLAGMICGPWSGPVVSDVLTGTGTDHQDRDYSGAYGIFMENLGQWSEEFCFVASTDFGHVALGESSIYYNLMDRSKMASFMTEMKDRLPARSGEEADTSIDGAVLKVSFRSSSCVRPSGISKVSSNTNFILGNDPSRYSCGVGSFEKVQYTGVWEDTDIIFSLHGGSLKYDIILGPGADTEAILFDVEGHSGLGITDGRLVISTPIGEALTEDSPAAWYGDGGKESLPVHFRKVDQNTYGFLVSGRDPERRIVIDPLVSSTYYGGSSEELISKSCLDASGNTYCTGVTVSMNFPVTSGAYKTSMLDWIDAFAFKLNKDLTSIAFSTYLGGSDYDWGYGICFDTGGNVYVTGETSSQDFPVKNAFNSTHWNETWYYDVFVTKFNPAGTDIVFSTYVAGEDDDVGMDIAVDSSGRPYVVGYTFSTEFPTTSGAYSEELKGWLDIILFRLSSTGSSMEYSTYMGGFQSEIGYSLWLDSGDDVYVTGFTDSRDFPVTTSASLQGSEDVIAFKFDIDGNSLIYSTMLGGDLNDEGYSITADKQGNAYITGYTSGGSGSNFPTTAGAYDTSFNGGDYDVFVTKLGPQGSNLIYSTYVGSGSNERGTFVRIDENKFAHVVGYTDSSGFPTTPTADYTTFQGGDEDCFIFKLSDAGSFLAFSSYLGGSDTEEAASVHVDSNGEAFVSGYTYSSNFPTTSGTVYPSSRGALDGFVTVMNLSTPPSQPRNLVVQGGVGRINISFEKPLFDSGMAVTHYTIYRGSSAADQHRYAKLTDLSFTDPDVENGVPYFYSVSANNSIGESVRSPAKSGMSIGITGPPKDLAAERGIGCVNLTWKAPEKNGGSPLTGYRIYRGSASNELDALTDVEPQMLKYQDKDVEFGGIYFYRLTALNQVGESPPSLIVNASVPDVPSAPPELTIASGNRWVRLEWSAPLEDGGLPVLGFRIYKEDGVGIRKLHATVGSHVLFYNDTAVVNGMTYVYNVTAFNEAGESKPTENRSATPMTIPDAPHIFDQEVGNSFVNISWIPPSNTGGDPISLYRIYCSSVIFEEERTFDVDAPGNFFLHSGLTNGMLYEYQVTAFNTAGESERSNSLALMPIARPGPPKSPVLTTGDEFIVITWEAPDNDGGLPILYYNIYKGTVSGEHKLLGYSDTMSVNDSEVTNGVEYFYVVTSVTEFSESAKSIEVSAVPMRVPDGPKDLDIVERDGRIDLSWEAPDNDGGSPVMGYRLFRGDSPDNMEKIADLGADIRSYIDPNVTNGVEYYYGISALNIRGASAKALFIPAVPKGPPSSPRNLKAERKGDSIVLTWDEPEDDGGSEITSYTIHRSEDGGDPANIHSVSNEITSYVDNDVKPGSSYAYTVKAVNGVGAGPDSEPAVMKLGKEEEGMGIGAVIGISAAVAAVLIAAGAVIFLLIRRKKKTVPPQDIQQYPQQQEAQQPGLQGVSQGALPPQQPYQYQFPPQQTYPPQQQFPPREQTAQLQPAAASLNQYDQPWSAPMEPAQEPSPQNIHPQEAVPASMEGPQMDVEYDPTQVEAVENLELPDPQQ
ncbi:MAG: fibronectin type III domain-containing protein [Thermoplasmatota archaeon]